MTRNKTYRQQLEGQRQALKEHLQKIEKEQEKPLKARDRGLITYWKKTVANCRQQIAKLERRLER